MTTEPTPPPPKLHPALAVQLLPFVLVYEGLRWLGRTVRDGLGPLSRFVVRVLAPVRVLADLIAAVFGRAGSALAGALAAVGHALAPAGRALATPFIWFGRRLSAALWKLDHAAGWAWEQTARIRAAVARVAARVLGTVRDLGSAALAPFRPIGRAARRTRHAIGSRARGISAYVRRLGARTRRTFRR